MVTKTKAHKDLVWMLLSLGVVVSLFTMGLAKIVKPGNGPFVWLIGLGMMMFFLTFLFFPMMYQTVGSQWELANRDYQEMVSLKDAKILEVQNRLLAVNSTFLTQQIVDNRLFTLALAVEELFNVQVQLCEDEEEGQIAVIAAGLAQAKSEFWSAHKLAMYLGFAVREKIKDYTSGHSSDDGNRFGG